MARVSPAMAASGGFMAYPLGLSSLVYYDRDYSAFPVKIPVKDLPMRVGIIAFMHESNTFIASPTTLAHFEQDLLVEGEEVRPRLANAHHETGGFFQGLAEAKIEAVPIFAARALPHGTVQADVF